MADSPLIIKSKEFALQIIKVCNYVKQTKKESVLTNQLMRSGTSIGANIHESKYAHGTTDFISKMQIALKECYESEYWLELLNRTGYIDDERYNKILNDCGQIRRMLISSINTVKNNKWGNKMRNVFVAFLVCIAIFAGCVNDTISSNEMLEHSIKNYYSNSDSDNNGEQKIKKVELYDDNSVLQAELDKTIKESAEGA